MIGEGTGGLAAYRLVRGPGGDDRDPRRPRRRRNRAEDAGARQRLVVDALGQRPRQGVKVGRVEAGQQQAPLRLLRPREDVRQLLRRLARAEHGLLDADTRAALEIESNGGGRAHAGCAGLRKALPTR